MPSSILVLGARLACFRPLLKMSAPWRRAHLLLAVRFRTPYHRKAWWWVGWASCIRPKTQAETLSSAEVPAARFCRGPRHARAFSNAKRPGGKTLSSRQPPWIRHRRCAGGRGNRLRCGPWSRAIDRKSTVRHRRKRSVDIRRRGNPADTRSDSRLLHSGTPSDGRRSHGGTAIRIRTPG
jgi:hypothetical protein